MNIFINTQTLEYPLYEGDIRALHPNISENMTGDLFVCPEGFALVEEVAMPSVSSANEYAIEAPPVFLNGKWTQVWEIKIRTQEEIDKIAAFFADLEALKASQNPVNTEVPDVIG